MSDLFQALAAPFPPERVSWRVGSTTRDKKKGMALAYIDARDVMDRFDAVCGPAGWERRHPHVEKTTTCEIAVWVPEHGRWVVKSDGAGDTAVEAEKGSLSDSFKRAAVNWGVGRYLYDLPSPWVELEERGNTHVIPAAELTRLRGLLAVRQDSPAARPAAPPPAQAKPAVLPLSTRADVVEKALRACVTRPEAEKVFARASKLCAELDTADPERLAQLEALYKLTELLPDVPPKAATAPNDFGLNGDQIPQFN